LEIQQLGGILQLNRLQLGMKGAILAHITNSLAQLLAFLYRFHVTEPARLSQLKADMLLSDETHLHKIRVFI
jgi:hypothetical protein